MAQETIYSDPTSQMVLPIITWMFSGSKPFRNFRLKLIPSKSTKTLLKTSKPFSGTICKQTHSRISHPGKKQVRDKKRGKWHRTYLPFDQVLVPWAVHLLILQEDTIFGPRTHKMVVTGASGQAAADCGTRLLAELTSLQDWHVTLIVKLHKYCTVKMNVTYLINIIISENSKLVHLFCP